MSSQLLWEDPCARECLEILIYRSIKLYVEELLRKCHYIVPSSTCEEICDNVWFKEPVHECGEPKPDLKKQCNGLQITLYVIILEDYCEL